jgi:hypothetical protein
MPIVTIIKKLPAEPTLEVAKQQIGLYMGELIGLWMEHHGRFIAGIRFSFLAFPPGAWAPAKAGVVRDATAFETSAGTVRWAFAVTDEKVPADTPREYGLWSIKPDPDFFPPGV